MRVLPILALLAVVLAPCSARAAADDGTPCTTDTQCTSTFCVDGVCCANHCGGGTSDCQVCSVALGASADGTCSALPEGSACGPAASCTAGLLTPAAACDGLTVNCEPALVIGCVPYQCGTGACLTTCTTNGDCGIGYRCDGLSCVADVDVSFPDVGPRDAGARDSGVRDSGTRDAGHDATVRDAASPPVDAEARDATVALDAPPADASVTPARSTCGCAVPSASTHGGSAVVLVLALVVALRSRVAARSATRRAPHRP